jgi:uncharacterized protein YkwD
MQKVFLTLLTGVVFFLAGCSGVTGGGGGSETITDPKPYKAPGISDADKQDYLDAINNARGNAQHCGTKGDFPATTDLAWNDALYKAAYEHDDDMIKSNIINGDHTGSNTASDYTTQQQGLDHGSTIQERIENNGYGTWLTIGENLTVGTTTDTAEKAVQAWLDSDSHCSNLMNPDFKEVGMAHMEQAGSKYTHYWTQDFGAR